MLLQNNPNYKWINEIKTILNSVGRTDIWLKQNDLHGTNRRISKKTSFNRSIPTNLASANVKV